MLDISNKLPGSGINSSARDLGVFMMALYGGRLVTSATWNQMITPARTRDGKPTIYGYGWFVGGITGCGRSGTAAMSKDLKACSRRYRRRGSLSSS